MAANDTVRNRQKGAVSVEFALVAPLMVLLVLGGVHFGKVLMTRHELTDATNHATRAAAVAGNTNANQVRNLIVSRMGNGNNGCSNIQVSTATGTVLGQNELRVTARCLLDTGIGGNLLGAVGPDDLTVSAAMPY